VIKLHITLQKNVSYGSVMHKIAETMVTGAAKCPVAVEAVVVVT